MKSSIARPGNIPLEATMSTKQAPYRQRQMINGSTKVVTLIVKTVMYDNEADFELANGTLVHTKKVEGLL